MHYIIIKGASDAMHNGALYLNYYYYYIIIIIIIIIITIIIIIIIIITYNVINNSGRLLQIIYVSFCILNCLLSQHHFTSPNILFFFFVVQVSSEGSVPANDGKSNSRYVSCSKPNLHHHKAK